MKRQFSVIVFILVSIIGQAHAQVIWEKIVLPEPGSFSIQASPNGKLFLSMKKNLYVSTNEGNTWVIVGTPSNFQIDSLGVFVRLKNGDSVMYHSTDEGKSWFGDTIKQIYAQFFTITKDSIYIFTAGPSVYRTINYGKSFGDFTSYYYGSDLHWLAPFVSPLGKVYGIQSFCDCLTNVNKNRGRVKVVGHFTCFADNSPPRFVSFDYSGFGYFEELCILARSSDNGVSWIVIDSIQNPNHRYFPPYLSMLDNSLLIVNDSETVVSNDHADTWHRIGDGVHGSNGMMGYYGETFSFVDRNGFGYLIVDTALYRMSLFASVHSSHPTLEDISVRFDPSANQLTLQSETPLGSTTASLYSVDGRLLKRAKLDISSPGIFSIDVSDVHTHFAILVLQTGRGVITRKILF